MAAETAFFILKIDEFDFTDEQERQWLQEHLDNPEKLAILPEIEDAIVGFLSFENGLHKRIRHRGIFVEKSWRGKGIASILLKSLIDWMAANPLIEKIGLTVHPKNEKAIRLYRKFGFVEGAAGPKS